MILKHSFLYFAVVWLLGSIACSSVDTLPAVTPTPLPAPTSDPGSSQPEDLEMFTVAQVIDSDTIELADGRRVRYIGINTPERDQPYYKEAAETNRQLVEGQEIQLEFDVETFDKYGRTLAYVRVDGVMANLEIVRLGFANAW